MIMSHELKTAIITIKKTDKGRSYHVLNLLQHYYRITGKFGDLKIVKFITAKLI